MSESTTEKPADFVEEGPVEPDDEALSSEPVEQTTDEVEDPEVTEPTDPGEDPTPQEQTDLTPRKLTPRKASPRVRFRGRWTCECVARSLPLVEKDMINKGIIKNNVDIFQMGYNTGGVAASAGTHDGGGCTDVGQYSDRALKLWREWGWTQQHRTRAQGFSPHGHGFPKGCSHLSSGARYQASEWQAGRNGLRSRGPITGPSPKGKATPTWTQAIKNKSKTTPTKPLELGVLGMSKNVYFRRSTDIPIKSDMVWRDVPISEKDLKAYSVIVGPNNTNILSATLSIKGLLAGEKVDIAFRLVEFDAKTKKSKQKAIRVPVTAASVAGKIVARSAGWSGAVPKGHRLRVAVRTSAKGAVIDQIMVQGVKS